jgi:glycosyltransferase involved in cell wall biosynthesis
LHALALVRRPSLALVVIGGGRLRPELERLAGDLGLAGQVRFLGALPSGAAVREHLHAADLFVMPSRAEGLPRAMIEAMACALPCLGSSIGGITELLAPACLFPPDDPAALAAALRAALADPQRLTRLSADNLRAAQPYRRDLLHARRLAFYQHLADLARQPASHARPPRR